MKSTPGDTEGNRLCRRSYFASATNRMVRTSEFLPKILEIAPTCHYVAPDMHKHIKCCFWRMPVVVLYVAGRRIRFVTFYLADYVSSQNNRWLSTENQHEFAEKTLPDQKVGAWWGIPHKRKLGPIFFARSIDANERTNRNCKEISFPFIGRGRNYQRMRPRRWSWNNIQETSALAALPLITPCAKKPSETISRAFQHRCRQGARQPN